MRDPFEVYARVEEQQQRQHAKSAKGRAQRAREGIKSLFEEKPMTQDESMDVDALLMIWYVQAHAYRLQLDVPGASIYAKDFRTSETRRSDADLREEADEKLNEIIGDSVDACLDSLPALQRSAVELRCAAKHTGCSVIRNPRMTIEQHHEQYQAAKLALLPLFKKRELMR